MKPRRSERILWALALALVTACLWIGALRSPMAGPQPNAECTMSATEPEPDPPTWPWPSPFPKPQPPSPAPSPKPK